VSTGGGAGQTPASQSAQTSAPGAGTAVPGFTAGVGSQFGRYSVVKKLGRGAMGDVYLVRDDKIGRDAAMKTIRPDVDLTPQQAIEMRQRFYREAQTAGKLTHANIVTIYDVGEEQGVSYIVMEFVEGDTLTNMRKKRALTVPQIKHVIVNAALGLDFAHQNGVFHRDVKPDNIMISKTGAVKVMDFGIARLVESDMTRTGSVLGTPAYMSPEQFAGKKVDARSDIFSLAVVLYELVTRKRPFTGQTPTEVMFAIIQKEPLPPSQAREGVNPAWDPILAKAMAKDPDQRYPTAREFAAAVRDCPDK
jgi:serine/threonine-protein kinase